MAFTAKAVQIDTYQAKDRKPNLSRLSVRRYEVGKQAHRVLVVSRQG